MDKSPCLIPWDLGKKNLKIIKNEAILIWEPIGTSGTCVLTDENGNWYALISTCYYILIAQNNKSFLIWKRDSEKINDCQKIQLFYYEVEKLQPITEKEKILSRIKKVESSFSGEYIKKERVEIFFAVEPTIKFEFLFNPRKDAMKFNFPEELKKFKEFILIIEFENLYENFASNWYNTTMLFINTENGWIYNYPQDWFNKSNYDFEYQGITRAVKHPETHFIYGQGIRLSDFVLDKTNRQLLK